MNKQNKNSEMITTEKINEVMRLLNVSDNDVGAMIGAAIELIRKSKLQLESLIPEITVMDVGGLSLGIEYKIAYLTPKKAAQLGWTLSEQLIERGLDRAGVYVGFWGTTDAWDEGLLGESEAYVALAPIEESDRLKDVLMV